MSELKRIWVPYYNRPTEETDQWYRYEWECKSVESKEACTDLFLMKQGYVDIEQANALGWTIEEFTTSPTPALTEEDEADIDILRMQVELHLLPKFDRIIAKLRKG